MTRAQRQREEESEKALVAAASAWPRGQAVVVTKDDGTQFTTKTRSKPWLVCGVAVILVDGISGGYRLTRVRPVGT